jgi:hypothetical protein
MTSFHSWKLLISLEVLDVSYSIYVHRHRRILVSNTGESNPTRLVTFKVTVICAQAVGFNP